MSGQWKIPHQVERILGILEEKGYESYVVGGCVRDLYMGRTPHDWDICTNASPQEVMEAVWPLPVVETGLKHGTVTVVLNHVGYEVTTYRTEGNYSDGRHPDEVVFVKDLREDLKRRDFTMNAMAYNPREGFVDLFGGREDLSRNLVRCVGEARERFSEDVLRIMRAVRFAAVFSFDIEEETKRAIHECACDLPRVSTERITSEFRKMVQGKGFVEEVRQFPDLFVVFLPELRPLLGGGGLEEALCLVKTVQELGGDEITVIAAFLSCLKEGEVVNRILRRLKFDNASREGVVTLVRFFGEGLFNHKGAGDEKELRNRMRRLLGTLGEEALNRLLLLWEAEHINGQEMELACSCRAGKNTSADLDPGRKAETEVLEKDLGDLGRARLILEELLRSEGRIDLRTLDIGGRELMEMGVPGGKQMGECLSHLLNRVLDGELPNERERLKGAVREYFEGRM